MSDSVRKYLEMLEDGEINPVENQTWIYESPDGGKMVTARSFGGDISDRKVIKHPVSDIKQKAYRLLCEYDDEVIRMAMKIIDIGE